MAFKREWKLAEATIVERRLVSEWHSKGPLGEYARVYEYMADIRPDDGTPPFRASLNEPTNGLHFQQPNVQDVVRVKYLDSARTESGSTKWKLTSVKFDQSDPGLRHHDRLRETDERAVAESKSLEGEARWAQIRASGPDSSSTPGGGRGLASDHDDHPDPRVMTARVALRLAKRAGNTADVERLTAVLEQLKDQPSDTRSRPQASSPIAAESVEQRLAKLQRLRDDGVLSSEEYSTQRQRILDSL